jgi:hypothetical protein
VTHYSLWTVKVGFCHCLYLLRKYNNLGLIFLKMLDSGHAYECSVIFSVPLLFPQNIPLQQLL